MKKLIHYNNHCVYNAEDYKEDLPDNPVTMEKDPILTTIFACNPVTGKPSCDLGLVFNSNTSKEVQDYVRQQLAVAQRQVNSVSQSPDDALEVVKSQFETNEEYANRIRNYINNLNVE